jgi:hypothetical protein
MTTTYGLTVDQALARLMVAERITDEAERRREYRKILNDVRSHGYHEGSDDGYEQAVQQWDDSSF